MNRYARVGFVLALLPVAACSSLGMSSTASNSPPAAPAPMVASNDMMFLTAASNAGEAEIQLSKLAQTKGRRIGIRKFADQMVTDHTLVDQQLRQFASSKDVTLTPTLSPEDASMLQQLQGESGVAFDHDYIHGQMLAHQKTIALFQQEANSGTDPALKRIAVETLPKLQMHLKLAVAEDHTEDRLMRRMHSRSMH